MVSCTRIDFRFPAWLDRNNDHISCKPRRSEPLRDYCALFRECPSGLTQDKNIIFDTEYQEARGKMEYELEDT